MALLVFTSAAILSACGSERGGGDAADPASCETILAAGILFGARLPDGDFDGQTPVILRLEDGRWTRATLPGTAGGRPVRDLSGVTFSREEDERAWAWGGGAEVGGIALRSSDDGRTWQDATFRLPAEVQAGGDRFLGASFWTEQRGWIATGAFLRVGPITIYATTDAGTSWDERIVPTLTGAGATVFGRRDEVEEVMLQGAGTQIVRLEDGTAELVGEGRSSSSLSPVSLVDGLDYATSGSRGWIAGRSRDDTIGAPVVYSAARGELWMSQPVEFDGLGALHAIDFSDASNGVTCGSSKSRTSAAQDALCFWTSDGGATWKRSEMFVPDGVELVSDVALCTGGTAWAVASGEGSSLAFLRSLDGGARWEKVSVPGVEAGRVHALSRDAVR